MVEMVLDDEPTTYMPSPENCICEQVIFNHIWPPCHY